MLNLRNVLKIPSFSGYEDLVSNYIENFCIDNKIIYKKDKKGNIYITKGELKENEYFPCVLAHMDTVHKDQIDLIQKDINLDIEECNVDGQTLLYARNPINGSPTGIGGDDKCGVYICLKLLEKIDKIKCAFFVEEEIGMLGSRECDIEFFQDVGYALQFDAPTNNWFSFSCSGHRLWTEEYFDVIQNILNEYKIENISQDPFTDVVQLRKKFDFCCSVLPTGYYNQHTPKEYVVEQETENCVNLALDFVDKLGNKKYYFEKSPAQGSF